MFQEAIDYLKTREKVNLLIAVINVAVFIVLSFLGDTESAGFILDHGGSYTPYVLGGEYWRLITAVFLHFGLPHLLYNMICLMAVGDRIEILFGPIRYLLIFVLGGVAGNAMTVFIEMRTGDFAVSAGASGAVFALIGAMAAYIIGHRRSFNKAMTSRLLIVAVLMLGEGFTAAGTNNIAHVTGAVTGLILGGVFQLFSRGKRR